jgi:hypothetical protein
MVEFDAASFVARLEAADFVPFYFEGRAYFTEPENPTDDDCLDAFAA